MEFNNLCRCRVLTEDECDHCKQSSKDVMHALWNCLTPQPIWNSTPQPIWNSTPDWLFRQSRIFPKFRDLFHYVNSERKKSRRLELFAMLVWTVWHCRNHIRTTPLRTILSHKSSLWPLKLQQILFDTFLLPQGSMVTFYSSLG